MANRLRLALMVLAWLLFWVVIGCLLGLLLRVIWLGIIFGVVIAIAYASFSQWGAQKFILDLYDAELLESDAAPNLYTMVAELSEQAGIEPPLVYTVPIHAPNAFAIGRTEGSGTIGITNGLTLSLEKEEVRAIIALMIARIAGGEATLWAIAATLAGQPLNWARSAGVNDTVYDRLSIDPNEAMTVIGKVLLSVSIPPCAASLRIGFDPSAVTAADDRAVALTQDSRSLASALRKIQKGLPTTGWGASGYNPATALLFAVPPLPPEGTLTAQSSFWIRAQRSFPYQKPDATERGTRLSPASKTTGRTAS